MFETHSASEFTPFVKSQTVYLLFVYFFLYIRYTSRGYLLKIFAFMLNLLRQTGLTSSLCSFSLTFLDSKGLHAYSYFRKVACNRIGNE